MPQSWPAEVIEVEDDICSLTGYMVMSEIEYKQYIHTHQNEYNVWQQNQKNKLQIIQAQVKNKILNAMKFGEDLIANYCVENVMRGLSVAQIQDIMIRTQQIQTDLYAGSLYVALDDISKINPDPILIRQSTLDNFRHQIQDYLGMPRT